MDSGLYHTYKVKGFHWVLLSEALDGISVQSRHQHGNEKHSTKPPAQADKQRKERNAKWKKYEYEVDIRPGKQTENDMPETN
jgi:hypothetical protein